MKAMAASAQTAWGDAPKRIVQSYKERSMAGRFPFHQRDLPSISRTRAVSTLRLV